MPLSPEVRLSGSLASGGGGDQVLDAVELLYEAIVQGRLRPGTAATQVHLAQLLGVGRTPLREALRIAHSDGLVEFGGRKTTISELSSRDAEDLYVMRILLESLCVRATVPTLASSDVANLEALLAQMTHFGEAGELDALEASNRRFHGILVGARQPRTERLLNQLDRHAERYRRTLYASLPGGLHVIRDEHRGILDAAKRGDVDATVSLLVAHYARTAELVIGLLDPDYDAPRLKMATRAATTRPDVASHSNGAASPSPS